MRRVLVALSALAVLTVVMPSPASAQYGQSGRPGQQQQRDRSGQQADGSANEAPDRAPRIAPLRRRANAGPCPYVKILYDAARYVELADNRAAVANIGYTGEIEGLTSACAYTDDQPITVQLDLLFELGRGARATSDQNTYRYWIAVTERNNAVLAKTYFDLPVDFAGGTTASVTQEQTVVIPRRDAVVSGGNFEVLVGFDVTPEMAEFNRAGSRFRVNAGVAATQ